MKIQKELRFNIDTFRQKINLNFIKAKKKYREPSSIQRHEYSLIKGMMIRILDKMNDPEYTCDLNQWEE